MLLFKQGQSAPLAVEASDGSTGLFARAKVFNFDGSSTLATVSMPHVSSGLYVGLYTAGSSGFQHVQFQFFTDAGFTTPAAYDIGNDQIRVLGSDEDDIQTRLGVPVSTDVTADIANATAAANAANASAIAAGVSAATAATAATAAEVAAVIARRILGNHSKVVGTQLIIYADDQTTPLFTFNLLDDVGNPSITRVFERVPV